MPRKTYRKRPYRRRRRRFAYRKKRASAGPRVINTRSVIAPDSILVKLPYSDTAYTTATGTFGALQKFRLNSIYDPDYSGSGHQPMGYDQWTAIYERYTVIGAKVELQLYSTGSEIVDFVCFPSSFVTDPASIYAAKEVKRAWKTIVTPGEKPVKKSFYFDMKKILGQKDLSDDQFKTAIGTNPSDDAYLLCYTANVDGSTAIAFSMMARITYYTRLDCCKLITSS